jgi:diguanylate cyclase (GGDEF)-like protein/PAS domain S-box-containing protein
MKFVAAAIYWVIVSLWLAVLASIVISYVRNPSKFRAARALLIIVTIDTLRNLLENGYFGLYFGSQYGFFPESIAHVLGDPRLLIMPKLVNVAAASVVLGLMVLRWLPRDLEKRRRIELAIREKSGALRHEIEMGRRLFESSVDLILITDSKGNIVRANPSARVNLGYAPEELAGRSAADFVHPDDLESTRAEMRSARTGRVTRNFEMRYVHKDGRVLTFTWSGVWSEAEQKHFFFGRDVTKKKTAEAKLVHLAHFDQLTGLPNRVKLHGDLETLLGEERSATLSIALFDLDDFKDVNDTLGQTLGDELLQAIAARLTAAVGGGATVYRVGGDEFVIVFAALRDPVALAENVDALLYALGEPIEIGGQRLFIGASAGTAIAPADGRTVDELMSSADLALHEAKSAGGGAHRLFVPILRSQAQARRHLDLELRRAFGDREFEVYFQPQVRLSDGRIVGAEALLRWRHPERGIVGPGAFIDVLSKNAISLEVGRWILQTACMQAARWQRTGDVPVRVGVNIFPVQLHEDVLLQDIEQALLLARLPPSALEIEITENIALRQDESILAPLSALRERGVGLAFDDFGTGYASLSYLRRYPLSRIKIDKSFVQKIDRDDGTQDAAIVRSIVTMAHNLGLDVVAEGVETDAQAEFLRQEGCDHAQGFLYAKALPAIEFERLLREPPALRGFAVA